MKRWWRTLSAAALCLLPAAASALGGPTAAVAVAGVVAAAFAVGWPWLAEIPDRPTAIVLLALAGTANTVVAAWMDDGGPW
ncbi:MAG: hypothetical protein LBJ08_01875, partial [Bifidobacteriaceae bacterium]|nr:hypothetical protein [Bifidobacteriaceae bacterium]